MYVPRRVCVSECLSVHITTNRIEYVHHHTSGSCPLLPVSSVAARPSSHTSRATNGALWMPLKPRATEADASSRNPSPSPSSPPSLTPPTSFRASTAKLARGIILPSPKRAFQSPVAGLITSVRQTGQFACVLQVSLRQLCCLQFVGVIRDLLFIDWIVDICDLSPLSLPDTKL